MSSAKQRLYAFLLLCLHIAICAADAPSNRTCAVKQKPLVKRPSDRRYNTILSLDAGALRGIITVAVLEEVEQSIKRYLLENPHFLPRDVEITTLDDFDILLADYFDCVAGISAGGWASLYITTRGKGAACRFLNNPQIIEKYGDIRPGSAEGMRVFYKEYAAVIYPPEELSPPDTIPFDLTNADAPGTSSPLITLAGLERAMHDLLGDTTLADVETTMLVQAFDLVKDTTVNFVRNAFKDPPVSSTVRFFHPSGARPPPPSGSRNFLPDIEFETGKDYYLRDIGVATGAILAVQGAKSVSPIGSNATEFVLGDGYFAFSSSALFATFFVASETEQHNFESIAVLSVGAGVNTNDRTAFANAGVAGWLGGFNLIALMLNSGQAAIESLLDYMYYTNEKTKPYQYLRIQRVAPATTDEGALLSAGLVAPLIDAIETLGLQLAEEYRDSIDAFVRGFVF